jgi:hypothetical protein
MAAGVPFARTRLAIVLGERGEREGVDVMDEVERICRDALAAGEPDGWTALVTFLGATGRDEEAMRVYTCQLEPDYFTRS